MVIERPATDSSRESETRSRHEVGPAKVRLSGHTTQSGDEGRSFLTRGPRPGSFSPARTRGEPTSLPATARRLSSKLDGLCPFSAPMLLDPRLQEVRGLGPEPHDRVARPLRRPG